MHASDETMNGTHGLLVGYLLGFSGFWGPSILFRSTGQRHSLFVHIWLIGHWGGLWICF